MHGAAKGFGLPHMGVFLIGLVCGFAAALAFAAYKEGEPFLLLARFAGAQASLTTGRLAGLVRLAARQARRLTRRIRRAHRLRRARRRRATRSLSVAATPIDTPGATKPYRSCPACGNPVTNPAASFCGRCRAKLPTAIFPQPEMATVLGALEKAYQLWRRTPELALVLVQAALVLAGWELLTALIEGGSPAFVLSRPDGLAALESMSAREVLLATLTAFLVFPYVAAGTAGGIMRALDGAPDFTGFFEDGRRYFLRSYIGALAQVAIAAAACLAWLAGLLLIGGLAALTVPAGLLTLPPRPGPLLLAPLIFSISGMFLATAALFIVCAPYWVMGPVGAYEDGVAGVFRAVRVAGARRWSVLGILLVILAIGLTIGLALLIFAGDALLIDWRWLAKWPRSLLPLIIMLGAMNSILSGTWAVVTALLSFFALTTLFVFYRGALDASSGRDRQLTAAGP